MNTSDTENANQVTNQPTDKKHWLLPAIIVSLVAVSAVEAWYLYDTKTQLEGIQTAASQPVDSKADEVAVITEPAIAATPTQPAAPQHSIAQQSTGQQPTASAPSSSVHANPPQAGNNPSGQSYGYTDPFNDPFFQRGLNGQNPYAEIQRMQQEMDAMMRDAWQRHSQYFSNNGQQAYGPAWNQPGGNVFNMQMSSGDLKLDEQDDKYIVTLVVKDANKNNLNVNIDGDRLTVSGQQVQNNTQTDENGNTVFEGQMNASFSRSITLPGPVKPDSIHTQIHDNMLEITIAKAT